MVIIIILIVICIITSNIIIKFDRDIDELLIKYFSAEMFGEVSKLISNVNICWFIIGLCIGMVLMSFMRY